MSLNKEGLQHLWGKITNKINDLLETNLPEALGAIEFGGTQILRGTNFSDSFTSDGAWSTGHWRLASSAEDVGARSFIEVTDAPNGKIKLGWEIINNGTGVLDIAQNGIPVAIGQTYTISCYARGTGLLKLQYGRGTYHANTFLLENEVNWKKYSYTFTIGEVEDGSDNGLTNIYFGNIVNTSYSSGGTIQICGAKMEVGKIATDWDEAPEEGTFTNNLTIKKSEPYFYLTNESGGDESLGIHWSGTSAGNNTLGLYDVKNEEHLLTLSQATGQLTLKAPLPIASGGTEASTAKEALKNLGGAGITYVRTTGTSCDDYTEYGIYFFGSQTYAPTDIPVGVNGWLTVIPSAGGIFTKQFWTRAGTPGSNDHMTYVRTSNDNGWGAWQRFFTTKDIIPKENGGTGNANAIAENVSGVVEIANGGTGATDAATALTNLGALSDSGDTFGAEIVKYNTSSAAGSIAFHNGTSANNGAGIWLYGNSHSNAGKFRLQVYDTTNKKYHQLDGNPDGTLTWDKQRVLTAAQPVPIANGGTGATTVLDAISNLGLGVIRVQTEGTNLNNYKEYGIYSFTDGYVPTNIPTGVVNGWLLVLPMTMGYEGMIKQLFFRVGTLNENDYEIYTRTFSNSTWGNWSKIQKDTGTNALSLTISTSQTAYDATASNFTAYYNGKMVDLYLAGKATAEGNSSWTTVATLPAGYRPPKALYMDVPYWDLTKNYQNLRLRITTAGAIQFAQGKSGATYNFHLSFLAV